MRSRTVTLSTCVENTAFPYFSFTAPKDHLHIRGEYAQRCNCKEVGIGSPPHSWRILDQHLTIKAGYRITSTYVENTPFLATSFPVIADHLHIRGEYCENKTARVKVSGITSTYVENTLHLGTAIHDGEDHLHIRGEYYEALYRLLDRKGSPPHTWRILTGVFAVSSVIRITSTYVENTWWHGR